MTYPISYAPLSGNGQHQRYFEMRTAASDYEAGSTPHFNRRPNETVAALSKSMWRHGQQNVVYPQAEPPGIIATTVRKARTSLINSIGLHRMANQLTETGVSSTALRDTQYPEPP
jgi:hypothetical protein